MYGRTNERTDGQAYWRSDGRRVGGLANGQRDGQTDGRTAGGRTGGRTEGRTDGRRADWRTNRRTDERTDGRTEGGRTADWRRTDRWTDDPTDGVGYLLKNSFVIACFPCSCRDRLGSERSKHPIKFVFHLICLPLDAACPSRGFPPTSGGTRVRREARRFESSRRPRVRPLLKRHAGRCQREFGLCERGGSDGRASGFVRPVSGYSVCWDRGCARARGRGHARAVCSTCVGSRVRVRVRCGPR